MENLLNNPWFVGIVGGVLSGLLTTVISRWVLSRRDTREYAQKVATANREIIYAIRPGIPEGTLPSYDVVESLKSSTAREYSVEATDLLSPQEIAEDLMKEVMDSNFISAKSKADFCSQLSYLLIPPKATSVETTKPIPETTLSNYRERTITLASMMMGLFATMVTATFSLFRGNSLLSSEPLNVLLPTMVAMIGVMSVTYLYTYVRNNEKRREQREKDRDQKLDLKPMEDIGSETESSVKQH